MRPPEEAPKWRWPRAEVEWNQGLRYHLLDEPELTVDAGWPWIHLGERPLFDGRVGFKLHVDGAAFVERAGIPPVDDRVDVRRAFLTSSGTLHLLHPVQYSLEIGLVDKQFYLDSAWLMVRNVPWVGNVKLGGLEAPIGFDNLVSSRDRTFMEVAAPIQAFVPATAPGLQLSRSYANERVTGAFGWFTVGQRRDVGDRSRSLSRFVGRATWLVRDREEPAEPAAPELIHVGVAASYVFSGKDGVHYLARPESFLAPTAVDTGSLDARQAVVVGAEVAVRRGPLSFQGEYLHAFVDGSPGGRFPGLYVSASYLLTGETRPYDRDSAVFGQVLPARPLSLRARTFGAAECAARYSFLDLGDPPVAGGRMHVLSAGFNWYWNRYVRWQLGYELAFVDDGPLDGRLHVFQGRFQLVI